MSLTSSMYLGHILGLQGEVSKAHSNEPVRYHHYICIYSIRVLAIVLLGVTVLFEDEHYRVEENTRFVTLALVLDGDASVPVTVTVRTLDLLNSSVGDAATGKYSLHPDKYFRGLAITCQWAACT